MSSRPCSPKGGSPAYSSCSSEGGNFKEDQCCSSKRKCLRCMEQKYNNGASTNAFPTSGKFTRSFSVESAQSFEELFKNSEEDFSAEGTKVLFCKELNVTSDEDEDKKGIKRTYEDRQERRRNGRYKRHCSSEDYGDELPTIRPPSRCSVSSEISPRNPRRLPIIKDIEPSEDLSPSSKCSVRSDHRLAAKRLPKRHVRGKEKSKPVSNRNLLLTSSHQKDSKSQQSQDSIKNESGNKNKIIKVPGDAKKYSLEDNEEVTIYEKTIITVTSSDNYLMSDPLTCRYKPGISPISGQKIASVIKNQFRSDALKPASIGVYGTANKNAYRKDMLNRDASVTRSKNIHILPMIQELNNIGDDNAKSSIIRSGTKSASSTYSKLRDLVKSPGRSTAMTPNNMMLESKIQVRGFQSTPHGSTLFPNSCMKKETIRTTSKKSVRFMVSESQCNMGGESIPKKSFRLEKFPPVIPIRSPKGSNLTAAPVVMTIQNPTLELMKGSMRGEVMENIICRETAQRVIQEQLINKLGIIQNMSSNGSQSVHLLNGPSVISVPGEPFKFAIEATNSKVNCVQKFTAISQKRPGAENDIITEVVQYTLSDLGIPRNKNSNKDKDIRPSPDSEAKLEVMAMMDAKRRIQNSLELRRNEIRLKLTQPNPRKNELAYSNWEVSKVVPSNGKNTKSGSVSKPGVAGDVETSTKAKEKSVEKVNEFDLNRKLGEKTNGGNVSKSAIVGDVETPTKAKEKLVENVNEFDFNKKLGEETNGGSVSKPGRAGEVETPSNAKGKIVKKFNAVDDNSKLRDMSPHLRQGKNKNIAVSRAKHIQKETITTQKADPSKNDDTQVELMSGGSILTKSTKINKRPATSGAKSADGGDRSLLSAIGMTKGGVRPKSEESRKSTSGGSRSRGLRELNERSTASPGSASNGGYSIMETTSPKNRPPSRKPHMSMSGRTDKASSRSPARSPGAPRTPLTLRPSAEPDLKTTSTIREHLKSSVLHFAAPAEIQEPERAEEKPPKPRSKKMSGHPLRNKTLSEFLEERKLSMECPEKIKLNDTRRISEPNKKNS